MGQPRVISCVGRITAGRPFRPRFPHRQVLPHGDPRAWWVARRSGLAESLLGPRAHPAALPSVQGTRALSTVNTNAPTNYFNVRADYFKASGLASTSLRESARLGARRCPMGMGARRTVWPHRVFALPYRGPRVGRIVQQLGSVFPKYCAQARARATVHGWSRFLYKYIKYFTRTHDHEHHECHERRAPMDVAFLSRAGHTSLSSRVKNIKPRIKP